MKTILILLYFVVCFMGGVGLLLVKMRTEEHLKQRQEELKQDYWFESEDYERVKRLHKFHGIDASVRDSSGEWFFRDGKQCKLWDPRERKHEKG